MKKSFTAAPILMFILTLPVLAQETVSLTLQNAIDAAITNNKEITIARLEEESAKAKFRQTNAIFLPNIGVSYSAMTTTNPLNAFGFKLQQESVTPGDFNPEVLNHPTETHNFLTKASLQQPLLNLDLLYLRKAAFQGMDVYQHKTKHTQEYLRFEVKKSYLQLQLAYHAKEVLEEAVKTVREIYHATNNRFERGFLQKSDLLTVEVQVKTAENHLAEANSNIKNASDYLSLLMGAASGKIYTTENMITLTETETLETTVPDGRADFKAMQSALLAQDMMVHSEKMSLLPKLNAFAEYYINDKDALGFGANSYLAGAQLSWTLFNGLTTRNKISEQRIERNKIAEQLSYQKEKSQLDLERTIRQLEDSRFLLQQHDVAVAQATEALRILQNRYEQGLVTTNDILQSQTMVSQQKLNQAQAVFQFNNTLAYYHFLVSSEK